MKSWVPVARHVADAKHAMRDLVEAVNTHAGSRVAALKGEQHGTW